MSLVKYRIKEVAADLGMQAKDIAAIVEQYYEKPKSTAQVLEEDQLNLIFDLLTQRNQIESVEVVFAAAFAAKEAEEKRKAEEAAKKAAEEKKKPEENKASGKPAPAQPAPAAKPEEKKPAQPAKQPAEPQRKRERRVVALGQVIRSPLTVSEPVQVKVCCVMPGICSRAAAQVTSLKMEPGT